MAGSSGKRDQIVAVATRLFAEHGYHAVGIDLILAEATVAKMTLYRHFGSKEELVVEVLSQRADEIALELNSIATAEGNPGSRLRQVFEWYHDWVFSGSFFGCMFYRAASEYRERCGVVEQVQRQRTSLQSTITSLVHELGFSKRESREAASRICMLLDGALVAAVGSGDGRVIAEAWGAVMALLDLKGTAIRWRRSKCL